jgi:hypothetical protein
MVLAFALLTVVLVFGSTIFIVLSKMYESTERELDCVSQIRTHAAAVRVLKELKAPPITCPTKKVPVKEGEDPRAVIAKEMKRCWDMWGNGKTRLFGEELGMYCHVCSMVHVPSGDEVVGLQEYLARTQIPSKIPGTSALTYAQYLSGVRDGEYFDNEDFKKAAAASMPTSAPIGVVFYYIKGIEWQQRFYNQIANPVSLGVAGSVGGGVVAGLVAFGTVAAASGVGLPVGIVSYAVAGVVTVGGMLAGAYFGAWEGVASRYDIDYMAMIIVRPLTDEDIRMLGCTYAPAANE